MITTILKRTLGALTLASALVTTAQAGVTFETAVPGTFLFPGDIYSEAGFDFTPIGDFAAIDTVAAFGPGVGLDLAPPRGNNSQFMSVLNDSAIAMKASDGSAFRLAGLDIGYIAPLTRLFAPGEAAGLFLALYELADGSTDIMSWDFGAADNNGEFRFLSLGLNDMGILASGVTSLTFAACAYDGAGGCAFLSGGFSQFAVDNINVPEPGTLALLGLALAAAAAARRRQDRLSA